MRITKSPYFLFYDFSTNLYELTKFSNNKAFQEKKIGIKTLDRPEAQLGLRSAPGPAQLVAQPRQHRRGELTCGSYLP
jgi:hypothetical protein